MVDYCRPARDAVADPAGTASRRRGPAPVGSSVFAAGGLAATSSTAVLGPFTGGASLQFRIRAENAQGAGAWSNVIEIIVVAGGSVPAAPHGVQLAGGDGSVTVTWQAASDGPAVQGARSTEHPARSHATGADEPPALLENGTEDDLYASAGDRRTMTSRRSRPGFV